MKVRFVLIGVVVAAFAAGAVVYGQKARWGGARSATCVEISTSAPVRLLESEERSVRITNPTRSRRIEVSGMSSSCGCVRIQTSAFSLEPGETRSVPVRIEADRMVRDQHVVIWIERPDREPEEHALEFTVVPPVRGWPDAVIAEPDPQTGVLSVVIAPEYLDSVDSAMVYPAGSEVGIAGEFSPDRSRVEFPISETEAAGAEIAVEIRGVRWSRPVQIVP